MRYFLSFTCIIFWALSPKTQTVGVTEYTDNVQEGYVLFSPVSNDKTFLIDECGQIIQKWETLGVPGMMGKLTNEGDLYKARRSGSPIFSGGGVGGKIDGYDWDGNTLFTYDLRDSSFHQHHDIEILPNGNILALGWGFVIKSEVDEVGRSVSHPGGMYTEKIWELKRVDEVHYEVVWEWDVFDHLVQNVNEDLPNYGNPVDFPQRIDINYTNAVSPSIQDWLHCNSLDYNEELDQIILNSRNFGEFWIIDHSTTTEEAKTSSGGNAGMGGDILYRWGNPEAYGAGTPQDQVFYGQHDAHWIKEGLPGEGNILVFNNGAGRPGGNYSTIEEVVPPLEGFTYTMEEEAFGPSESILIYGAPTGEQAFFSQRISGAQRMANGSTLICMGNLGVLAEVNENKETDWLYVNPSGTFTSEQGDPPQTASNSIFQAVKYDPSFIGFEDKDVTPGEKIELKPIDNCTLVYNENFNEASWTAYYDIDHNALHIQNKSDKKIDIKLYNYNGLNVGNIQVNGFENYVYNTNLYPQSLYVAILFIEGHPSQQLKFTVLNE